jgi:hypothetical protein
LLLHLLGCACLGGCGRLGFQDVSQDASGPQVGADAGSMDAGADAATDSGPRDAGRLPDAADGDPDAGPDSGPGLDAMVDATSDDDAGAEDAGLFDPPPCVVDVVWETDFASDPTLLDRDNDGMPDWIVRGGGSFPASEIANGSWTSAGQLPLDTNPPRNLTTMVYVDVRLRSLRTPAAVTTDFEGALFWVNVDYTVTDFAPLFVSVSRTAADQQEVRFYGKSADAVSVVLLGPVTTGPGILHVRMEIDPVNSFMRGWIDGALIGSAGFPRVSDVVNSDRFATAFAASTPAEYDAARVAVCVP